MADEKIRVVKIDTNEAQVSIKDLKDKVKEYRTALDSAIVGSDEAKAASDNLAKAQAALTAAQKAAIDTTGNLNNSYNGLVQQMALLKNEQKQIDVSTKEGQKAFDDYAKKINNISDKLKDLDAKNGVFTRNVGNYTGALQEMGLKGFGGLINGITNTSKALSSFAKANPWIFALSVITAAIMGIINAMKKNQEALNRLKTALAPIQGLLNGVQNIVDSLSRALADKLGKAIDWITDKFKNFLTWIGKDDWVEKMNQATQITKEQIALEQERNRVQERNAEIQIELEELRAKFQKAEGDAAKQREISQQIAAKEHKIRKNNYDLAKREYDLIVKRNAQTDSNNQDLKAESDARVRMLQAQAELNRLTSEENKVIKRNAKDAATETTDVVKLIEKLNAWKDAQNNKKEENEDDLKKQYDEDLKLLEENEQKKIITVDVYNEKKKLLEEKYESDLKELRTQNAKKTITELNNVYTTGLSELDKNTTELLLKIEEEYANDEVGLAEAIKGVNKQVLQGKIDAEKEYIKLLEEQKNKMVELELDTLEIEKQIATASTNLLKLTLEQRRENNKEIREENKKTIEEEKKKFNKLIDDYVNAIDTLTEFTNTITSIGDGISSQWANVFENLSQGVSSVSKILKEEGIKSWKGWAQMAVVACNIASSALGALADEQDTETDDGFKRAKNLQIAQAVMSTAAGIVGAMSTSIIELGPTAGFIVGSVLSTMMATLGGLQIAAIKKTKMDGNGGSSSTAQTPSINGGSIATPQITYADVVNTNEQADAMANTEMWVSVSEINSTQDRVRVSESESRF